jgi:hypothetical protein
MIVYSSHSHSQPHRHNLFKGYILSHRQSQPRTISVASTPQPPSTPRPRQRPPPKQLALVKSQLASTHNSDSSVPFSSLEDSHPPVSIVESHYYIPCLQSLKHLNHLNPSSPSLTCRNAVHSSHARIADPALRLEEPRCDMSRTHCKWKTMPTSHFCSADTAEGEEDFGQLAQ